MITSQKLKKNGSHDPNHAILENIFIDSLS